MQQTLMQLSSSGTTTYTTETNKAVGIPEYNSVQVSKEKSTSIIRRAANSYEFLFYWSTTSVSNQQNKKKQFGESTNDAIIADEDADLDVNFMILPKAWMRLKGMHIKKESTIRTSDIFFSTCMCGSWRISNFLCLREWRYRWNTAAGTDWYSECVWYYSARIQLDTREIAT